MCVPNKVTYYIITHELQSTLIQALVFLCKDYCSLVGISGHLQALGTTAQQMLGPWYYPSDICGHVLRRPGGCILILNILDITKVFSFCYIKIATIKILFDIKHSNFDSFNLIMDEDRSS